MVDFNENGNDNKKNGTNTNKEINKENLSKIYFL